MNDGSMPVLTYFENSVVKVCPAGDDQPSFKSKSSAVGLGHVSKRKEVWEAKDGGGHLEVEVVHHDWDVQYIIRMPKLSQNAYFYVWDEKPRLRHLLTSRLILTSLLLCIKISPKKPPVPPQVTVNLCQTLR
ncbi:hypothetical protein KEM48_009157 [Puccinia striiformis f. sp. tritici PST-130]|nr:hypothetical protein KEM48_009157 [Puccinia striiformis f. sp. tritici PST-130]